MNYWNVLQGAGRLDPRVTEDFGWAVNDDGTLRSYDDMLRVKPDAVVTEGLQKMFSRLNNGQDAGFLSDAYDNVVQYRRDDK